MSDVLDRGTETGGITRRKMVGILVAGPTLIAATRYGVGTEAASAAPTAQPVDRYDLSDLLYDSTVPTQSLIVVEVKGDGTVHFDLPRAEVGQGITTSFAMVIADELDVALDKVVITLADAKPELQFNQFTGGSVATFEVPTS